MLGSWHIWFFDPLPDDCDTYLLWDMVGSVTWMDIENENIFIPITCANKNKCVKHDASYLLSSKNIQFLFHSLLCFDVRHILSDAPVERSGKKVLRKSGKVNGILDYTWDGNVVQLLEGFLIQYYIGSANILCWWTWKKSQWRLEQNVFLRSPVFAPLAGFWENCCLNGILQNSRLGWENKRKKN